MPNKSNLEISLTKLTGQCVKIDAAAVKKGYALPEEWTKLEAETNLLQHEKEEKQKSLEKRMNEFLAVLR